MRMKRPMVQMEVELSTMTGTHITPLTQNIFLNTPTKIPLIQPIIDLSEPFVNPVREELRLNFLETVNQVKGEIITFLDSSIVRG
jgi:hypothetical protein